MCFRTLFLVATCAAQPATAQLQWTDARALRVEGQGWTDTAAPWDRLPGRAEKTVRPPVWELSRDSAGICVRFRTDSPEIHVQWTLTRERLEMAHMPASGVSGLDLYVRHEGVWRWRANARPQRGKDPQQVRMVHGAEPVLREYLLYLPLYNGVRTLSVGVAEDAELEAGAAPPHAKPIVFYGTSITQGGCASRPGMVHTAILGRRLDRPVINLGFSGNGTMDASIADLLVELDPAVFVIDCLPNMRAKQVTERIQPLVDRLRAARPDTPILLVEDRTYDYAFAVPAARERHRTSRAALRAGYDALVARGVRGLHYLTGDALLGDDGEATVDGSHPTDLGFVRQADAFEPVLRPLCADR